MYKFKRSLTGLTCGLYFDEGMQVQCFAERNPATGQPGVDFSVFGYFVDKP